MGHHGQIYQHVLESGTVVMSTCQFLAQAFCIPFKTFEQNEMRMNMNFFMTLSLL